MAKCNVMVLLLRNRQTLTRPGAGPLAAGEDSLELRSRVQLLDGPFYEGSYLIGSVNFVSSTTATTADINGNSSILPLPCAFSKLSC